MHCGLLVTPSPGIAKRSEGGFYIASPQAVDQHQQVQRQCQQAIGNRFQHLKQQSQHDHRQQHQDRQHPPRVALAVALQARQFGAKETIALQSLAQCRELLDPQHQ
ncbi:hypothetical protein D3C77_262800 [compost metagenome]